MLNLRNEIKCKKNFKNLRLYIFSFIIGIERYKNKEKKIRTSIYFIGAYKF